jgi:FkbM family methyltransferase
MPSLANLRLFITSRPWLRAAVLVIAWPLVWWRRRSLLMQRELYERAVAFPAYGEVAIPVQGVEGAFLVDIRSDILRRVVFSGSYEPEAIATIRRVLPGKGDVIDIGANIGIFSVLMARAVGDRRVLAIEPTPAVARRLQRNISTNGVAANVIVEQCAVGGQTGEVTMNTVIGMEEYSRVGAMVLPDTAGKPIVAVTVPMHTLDDLITRHGLKPTLIKMDIEGSEMRALSGATATLSKHRPTILAEVDDRMLTAAGSSAAAVLGFLRARGYSVQRIDGASMDSDTGFIGDVLAIHAEGPAAE